MVGRLHLHGPHLRLPPMLQAVLTVFGPFLLLLAAVILVSEFVQWH